MTQHGSFPDRPRGRRARPDNDVPEWAGFDAVPDDQREFPGLSPIGGGQAHARDGRVQGDWMQDAQLPEAPAYPAQAQPHASPQASPAQPQASPQPRQRAAKHRAAQQDQDWDEAGAPDSDPMEAFSERWRRRGSDSRGDRRAERRKRRRLYAMAGGAGAAVIAIAVYFLGFGGSSSGPANLGLGSLVTSFLPGELQQVPNACTSVPNSLLTQYMPGPLKVAVPPLNTGASSQCTWTLDKAPDYRVLEVFLTAYSPSGLASGDGSATFAAEDAYAEDETAKQKPGPRSGQPQATVTDLPGMPGGSQTSAFEATQVFNESGAVSDVATVVVRYRNVIVTVVVNGLDHDNSRINYGPVSMSDLSSAGQNVAQQVTAQLVH